MVVHFRDALNFLNIDPFLTRPAPIESWERDLSIGATFIKTGSISNKDTSKTPGRHYANRTIYKDDRAPAVLSVHVQAILMI